jgi:RNA polymerase sigma factor (sigma-70 family)
MRWSPPLMRILLGKEGIMQNEQDDAFRKQLLARLAKDIDGCFPEWEEYFTPLVRAHVTAQLKRAPDDKHVSACVQSTFDLARVQLDQQRDKEEDLRKFLDGVERHLKDIASKCTERYLFVLLTISFPEYFRMMFEVYTEQLYQAARRVLTAKGIWDKDAAYECVNATYISVYNSLNNRRDDPAAILAINLGGYLWTAVTNHAQRYAQEQSEHRSKNKVLPEEEDNPVYQLEQKSFPKPGVSLEERETIEELLSELSSDKRRVVELSWLEGMSGPEVAAKLQMPPGTVRSHLFRAGQTLRQVFRK